MTLTDDFAGRPFDLRPFQEDVVRKLFGTLRPDGLRRYRRCLLFLPRKMAKTQLAAAIGLYCLLGAGRTGQTVLLAASDREQASHLYEKCVAMIEADPWLSRKCRVFGSVKQVRTVAGNNVLKTISADGHRQHGHNPSVVILDEVHAQPDRRLHDALATSFAARAEPLMLLISTAGNGRGTLIHDEYTYACKVRDGVVDDPGYLPVIYEAAPDDPWDSEDTWAKAMPALSLEAGDGGFIPVEHFRGLIARAKADPSEESIFKQYYLNLWVAAYTKWLNRPAWDECGKRPVDPAALKGKPCYAGLDLSNTSDLTAFSLVFPMPDGTFKALHHYWIPEEYARRRDAQGATKYLEWARRGLITLTDRAVIDYDLVRDRIVALSKSYRIRAVLADPWNSTQICHQLQDRGLAVELCRQGMATMNEPTKLLGVLLARGEFHHGDNAVLNWQADNVTTVRDSQGNYKFDKESSAEKIDGMVAMVMGLAGAMRQRTNAYSTRKPEFLERA